MNKSRFTRPLDNDALIALMLSGELNGMISGDFVCKYFPAQTYRESWKEFQNWTELHKGIVQWERFEAIPTIENSDVLIAFAKAKKNGWTVMECYWGPPKDVVWDGAKLVWDDEWWRSN